PQARELPDVARLGGDHALDPLVGRDDRDAVLPRRRDDVLGHLLVVVLARGEDERAQAGDLHRLTSEVAVAAVDDDRDAVDEAGVVGHDRDLAIQPAHALASAGLASIPQIGPASIRAVAARSSPSRRVPKTSLAPLAAPGGPGRTVAPACSFADRPAMTTWP